jgi:hypothetical protein
VPNAPPPVQTQAEPAQTEGEAVQTRAELVVRDWREFFGQVAAFKPGNAENSPAD